MAKDSINTKAREKYAQIWTPEFLKFLMYNWLNLKAIKYNLVKLPTDFYRQTSYLLCERFSLTM